MDMYAHGTFAYADEMIKTGNVTFNDKNKLYVDLFLSIYNEIIKIDYITFSDYRNIAKKCSCSMHKVKMVEKAIKRSKNNFEEETRFAEWRGIKA